MNGLVRYQFDDPSWGKFGIIRPIPKGDELWGCLKPLKGTEWEQWLPVVSGESMSHALHGYLAPLMKEIGPEPRLIAKQVPDLIGKCSMYVECMTAEPSCIPSGPPPDCYEAPSEFASVSSAATQVVWAWKSGDWVVVVGDGEFSL